jgi:hypothetical protein
MGLDEAEVRRAADGMAALERQRERPTSRRRLPLPPGEPDVLGYSCQRECTAGSHGPREGPYSPSRVFADLSLEVRSSSLELVPLSL